MSTSRRFRTLVVDDEPLACELIQGLLAQDAEVEVIGSCTDGASAVAVVTDHAPELLFLDVQMPEMDGFAVLEALGPAKLPVVIFVTAYDHYALRAFDSKALDYVVKPVDRERFRTALERAKTQLKLQREAEYGIQIQQLLKEFRGQAHYLKRLVVQRGNHSLVIRTDEVDWIEADANYVKVHCGRSVYLMRETLHNMVAKLAPERFRRIHRSTIVNVDRIRELHSWFHGDLRLKLEDGQELTVSRRYRANLSGLAGSL